MSDEMITWMVGHALASDEPDKAENLIGLFCDAIESWRIPDQRILEWLANRLREGLAHNPPKFALVPPLPKGQRRKRTLEKAAERDLEFTRAVIRYMEAGTPRDEAFERVAEAYGASEAVVKAAYDTYRRYV
jgi:hypothetical protein